ncbi:MAG TPA: ferrous iron transport protein A [Chloroflexia bacterium]|nr:ferrous iron transport protein A [Chloroflexia bacterium]
MRCAMCGYEFEQTDLTCHAACPLGAACSVVCCPRCGYSTVDPRRTSLASRVMGLFNRRSEAVAPQPEGAVPLLDLPAGACGHVADVEGDPARLVQLSQYGLLPGTPITLARKRPVPIVRIGHTDLALDRSVAAHVYVDLDPTP